MTQEYAAAVEAHSAAFRAFHKVREAYRSRQIGDVEFLAARKAFDEATAVFDVAFAAETA